ncbi:MAG TPA: GNAT family N-acetyltransferase [Candidatus Obscuribacterales bacterium]
MNPAGFLIRPAVPADAAGIARVHVLSWQHAYQGLLPQAMLDGLSIETRRRQWLEWLETPGSPSTLVALSPDPESHLAGFVSGGPVRGEYAGFDCEIAAIYLLPEVQGQGLGYLLFRRMQQELATAGYRRLLVWVLETNQPARRFYARLGGVPELEKTATLGVSIGLAPVDVKETGYGFEL